MRDRNDRGKGDEKKKMTWSEVDKIRDKSRQRDGDPMQKQSSPAAMAAQKSYRAALERAFENGKLGELAQTLTRTTEPKETKESKAKAAAADASAAKAAAADATAAEGTGGAPLPPAAPATKDPEREARQKLLGKIKDAEGRDAISKAVDGFLAKYPKLPDDYELLTKALGHRGDDCVRATIEQLTKMIAREKPKRGRTLAAQLRFLEDTHGDPDIRRMAAEVRGRL